MNRCQGSISRAIKTWTVAQLNPESQDNSHDQLGLEGFLERSSRGLATPSPQRVFLHGDTACEALGRRTIHLPTHRQEALVIVRRIAGTHIRGTQDETLPHREQPIIRYMCCDLGCVTRHQLTHNNRHRVRSSDANQYVLR